MAYVCKFFLTQTQESSASLTLPATPKQIQRQYTNTISEISSISVLRRYRRITFDLGAPTDVHAGRIGIWITLLMLYRFAGVSSFVFRCPGNERLDGYVMRIYSFVGLHI